MTERPILFDQLKVLLLEESDHDATIIDRMLGCEARSLIVIRVETRSEMEQALQSHVFDVILCDHDMKNFSSREALEVRDERGQDVPLILVAGAIGGEEAAIELMRSGVADVIPKHQMARLVLAIRREIQAALNQQAQRDADEALQDKKAALESAMQTLVRAQDELVRSGRMKGLGRMVAGITHDLNNALSRIVGLVEQLEECGDSEVPETYGLIRDAVDDATYTVRCLSCFCDVHPRDAKGKPVDINETIAESLDLFSSKLDASKNPHAPQVLITTNLGENPPVTGDEDHLRDAITSLILRANGSMPEGGELKITSYHNTSGVVVEVEDTGLGMSEEELQNCLESYYSADREPSRGGCLAWVNALVEKYGGVMKVESHDRAGTKVTLHFSIHATDNALPKADITAMTDSKPLRIMVVDDEMLIAQSLAACLKKDNHSVKTASNGFDALELLRDEPFDLMISDRAMRDCNGEELARRVRARGDGIKFILATGSGDQLIANRSHLDGVDAILPKPITRDSLRGAIRDSGVYLSA